MSDILLEKDVKISGQLTSLFKNCPKPDGWFGGILYSKELGQTRITGVCATKVSIGLYLDVIADLYDTNYGEQYKAKSVMISMDSDRSLIAYLSSAHFPKIGKITAEKIVKEFGLNTIDALMDTPDKVKEKCNLSDVQMNILVQGVFDNSVENKLQQAYPHLGSAFATAIVSQKKLGVSFDVISAKISYNPYILLEIEGLGFKKCDEVALLDCHLSWDDYRRVNEILRLSMNDFMRVNKSTYLDLNNKLNIALFENLVVDKLKHSVSSKFIADAITSLVNYHMFYLDTDDNQRNLYLSEMKSIENIIVDEINTHLNRNDALSRSAKSVFKRWKKMGKLSLNDGQEKALLTCFENHISCITGGPGRGKTYLIKSLADIWLKAGPLTNVIMLAPTGKAVNRMKTATGFHNVSTIARFMYRNLKNEDASYVTCEDSSQIYLSSNVLVIIDESSMLDFSEAAKILEMFGSCRLVFVGDKNQLPPIEVGPFFSELLKSNAVPVANLYDNMRSKSIEISENADKIISGDKRFTFTQNFMLSPSSDDDTLNDLVIKYKELLANGVDFKDILVMSPVKPGVAAVNGINAKMQELLNPLNNNNAKVRTDINNTRYINDRGFEIPAKKIDGLGFRVGDRVINLKNHAEQNTSVGNGIFNGDMGIITSYVFAGALNESPEVVIEFDENGIVSLPVEQLSEFALSYCITVHKAQGSEAEHVLISMPDNLSNSFFKNGFLTQNLLYTAVTRAKVGVTIFGNTDAILSCINKPYEYYNTRLYEFIYKKFFDNRTAFINQPTYKVGGFDSDFDGDVVGIKAGSRGGKGIILLKDMFSNKTNSED